MFGAEKFLRGLLRDKEGDAKSAGSSALPELKDGEILFTDQHNRMQPEVSKNKAVVAPAQPINGEKVAIQQRDAVSGASAESDKKEYGNKITMAHPLQVTEQRQLQLSALHLNKGDVSAEKKNAYLEQMAKLQKRKRAAVKEDVIKARSLRKGILGSIQQKKIDAVEQIRMAEEERRAEEEKIICIEAFRNENPEYYQKYEEEMAKLEPAFAREFEASREAYKTWERSLKRSDSKLLKSQEESPGKTEAQARMAAMDARFHKMADLVEAFNDLDTRFPEDGLKGLLLLAEMQGLEKKMPKDIQPKKRKFLVEQEKIYGNKDPNAERIEKGHIQVLIKRELEVLKRNCKKVRERRLFTTNTFHNIGQLEGSIQLLADLADSFDDETPLTKVEKALEELRILENGAFSDTPPERGESSDKKIIRRLRDEKEVAGVAKGKNKFERKRVDKRNLVPDETSAGVSQEPIPDRQVSFETVVAELKKGVSVLIPQAIARANQMWLEENTNLAVLVKSDPGRVTKRLVFIRDEIIKEVKKKGGEHKFSSGDVERAEKEIDAYAEQLLILELNKIVVASKI